MHRWFHVVMAELLNMWAANPFRTVKKIICTGLLLLVLRGITGHKFYVLLTVQPVMILVNNQLDAQFFMYVYFYSLHVSGSHVPIIRRIIVSMRHRVYVTLCRWPTGMQGMQVNLNTCISWWWAYGCPKHVENRNKHTWEIVRQFGYLQGS